MERRRFLTVTGASVLVATAGCSDSSGDDGSGGGGGSTESPESVVEAFYDIANSVQGEGDIEDAITDVEAIAHSASPLVSLLREQENSNEERDDITYDSVTATIVEEDLDQSTLQEQGWDFFLEEGQLATIAEASNAIVEAEIEQSGEDVPAGEEETTAEHLTAEEDGEWKLIL